MSSGRRDSAKRTVVTGGAGFVGSHLCDKLLSEGYRVLCLDSLITGSAHNIAHLRNDPAFEFVQHDVTQPLGPTLGVVDEVYHFASPASPQDFERLSVEILAVGSEGTRNALELARDKGARFMLASTSEVYGDPLVHPQHEGYLGNVNPTGIRGVYDESKRFAEALTTAYRRRHALEARIVRIFNTYGPRMRPDDGRMIPNFISQALSGKPLTVYGDGSQTRSVQYVDDLVEGVVRLMGSVEDRPVNIGNPVEYSVKEVAEIILELSGSESSLIYDPLPEDDPKQRCPNISRAREVLAWEPRFTFRQGIERAVAGSYSQTLPETVDQHHKDGECAYGCPSAHSTS